MNYQRIVQWAAGPLSALIGLGATAIVHTTISKNSALLVATFALTAAVNALAHWKWVDNLAKWWQHTENPSVTVATDATGQEKKV